MKKSDKQKNIPQAGARDTYASRAPSFVIVVVGKKDKPGAGDDASRAPSFVVVVVLEKTRYVELNNDK